MSLLTYFIFVYLKLKVNLVYYYTYLMAFFSRTAWISWYHKGRTILDFNEAEMTGWHWHQLSHMQIIYTLLQADNHTSISSLMLYESGALPDAQRTVW